MRYTEGGSLSGGTAACGAADAPQRFLLTGIGPEAPGIVVSGKAKGRKALPTGRLYAPFRSGPVQPAADVAFRCRSVRPAADVGHIPAPALMTGLKGL